MATEAQLLAGLKAADAAGNTEDARHFADAIKAVRASAQTPPAQEPPGVMGTVVDMARAIPGGLAKGVTATAGIPGDVNALLSAGGDWALSKLGMAPEDVKGFQQSRQDNAPAMQVPTSQALNDTVSKPFGGYYQPKTVPGEYTETVASFAPAALVGGGGGGGIGGNIARRVARAVVPGVASEAAGQATKDSDYSEYEGLARAGGALAGGMLQGGVEGLLGRPKAASAPSQDELGKLKSAAYKAAEQQGVVISPQSFQKFATDLGDDLTKNHVVQSELHKNALSALDVVQQEAAVGKPLTLERADAIRQAINNAVEQAGTATNGGDERLAMKIKGALDDYLDNLTPSDVVNGDPKVAVPILREARSLAQRQFKGEEIQKLIDLAKNQASSNFTGAGVEQALRVQFKNLNAKLIKYPSMAKGFTDAEREAIATVAKGGPMGNAMRWIGKWAPTGVVPISAGAYLAGGPMEAGIGALAIPAVGMVGRMGATAATKKNAEMAAALMRAGPNGAPVARGATSVPKQLLLDALLSQGAR